MKTTSSTAFGGAFTAALILCWTLTTALLAVTAWRSPDNPKRLATWMALWLFTVAVPTLHAIRIHERLNDVLLNCVTVPPPVRRDLMHARFVIVTCGSITALLAWALSVMP